MSHTGLIISHNLESEKYLARNLSAVRDAAMEPKKKKSWRNYYLNNDQGPTPRCTAFGTLTNLACTPITHPKHNPLADPQLFYQEIQLEDRKMGNHFSEGATADAAMKAARKNKWISAWRHIYTLDTGQAAIQIHPLIAATNWYPSMDDRDSNGVIRISVNDRTDSGHLYALNGYDPKKGLWRIANTWGDGDYYIEDETLFRLVHEAGDLIIVEETPVAVQ